MPDIQKTCALSGAHFTIDGRDQAFYEEAGVPHPTLCPDERQLRRMSWRNERNFYVRECDLCGRQIVSIYHKDSPYTVYCSECWWSDKWSGLDYGIEFDFGRPFFDQMHELQLRVPRMTLHQKNSQNCDYTNHSEDNKDCYMTVDTAKCQDVFYSKWMINCQDCTECYNLEDCQLCYESQYQVNGFKNMFNFFSDSCAESAFLYGCTNCQNCFMCSLQHRKEYCVRNEQLTREEYEKFMASVDLGSHEQVSKFYAEYKEMMVASPKRAGLLIMCEDCEGDCLYKCKNVIDSFDIVESRDCRYCYESGWMTDCYDTYESGFENERQYECHACNRGKFIKFCHVSYDVNNCEYADTCHNSSDLFGCVGIRHKKFCIFNKQYSQEEYEILRAKIVEHMRKTCEYGEFFPTRFSPFAYNETIAQEYYPIDKEFAAVRGGRWKDETQFPAPPTDRYALPDKLTDTEDSVCKETLYCEKTWRPYKIAAQELAVYRKIGATLPRTCPQQRYLERMSLRNYRRLWNQTCAKCDKNIRAPYPPNLAQDVFCQECFVEMKYA